jgi:hypothetical protein
MFGRMKDPVAGTANVVSATTLDPSASGKESCAMELIVQGDGLTPTAVAFKDKVPVIRWPRAGDVLPITVDRSNPEHLEIDWDAVPIRGQAVVAAPAVATPDGALSFSEQHPEIPPEAAEIVDRITSMFPNAQVNVAEPTVIHMDGSGTDLTTLMGAGGSDRISQLERLAKLHEEGALSDDEFEAEKKRVLEGS